MSKFQCYDNLGKMSPARYIIFAPEAHIKITSAKNPADYFEVSDYKEDELGEAWKEVELFTLPLDVRTQIFFALQQQAQLV